MDFFTLHDSDFPSEGCLLDDQFFLDSDNLAEMVLPSELVDDEFEDVLLLHLAHAMARPRFFVNAFHFGDALVKDDVVAHAHHLLKRATGMKHCNSNPFCLKLR